MQKQAPSSEGPRCSVASGAALPAVTDKHVPLTYEDRVQAVRRTPEFLSDAREFCGQMEQEISVLPPEEKSRKLIELLTNNAIAQRWGVPPAAVLGAGAMLLSARRPFPEGHARRMMVRDVREGRYLTLEFDLTMPEVENLKHGMAALSHYHALLGPKSKRRNKPTHLDPWLVHDMHHHGKLSLLQITHLLFRSKGNPAYDETVSRNYKCVQRAYQKAEAMIHSVSKSNPS